LTREISTRRKIILQHMLRCLENKTITRTDWQLLTQLSSSAFNTTLKLLLKQKFVERVQRGVYRTTEEGKKFLKMLS